MLNDKEFLKTYEISTEILNLISSSKSYCYIISPYIRLWPQLERLLSSVSNNESILTFIIREDPKAEQLVKKLNGELGFEVIVIKDLHIKLYLNEEKCILSTMNLYDASQQNNLELGYFLRDSKKVKKEIIDNYILNDPTARKYQGKFEEKRTLILTKINLINSILSQEGYCVDCNIKIPSDFRPWTARKIRCLECYRKCNDLDNSKIRFCHFCGDKHNSTGQYPFHSDCSKKLKEYTKESRKYNI